MPTPAKPARYAITAQLLHWVIAGLIVTQFVLGRMALHLPLGARKLGLLARHKSVGMTILMLALLRLAWRLRHRAPELPAAMRPWERRAAHASHLALYVLIFAMPITGWMMSSAKNYSVSWFGLFTWPNLIGKSETAFNILRSTHDAMSYVLFTVAALHILAALKHHFWDRDEVLVRMTPFSHQR